jgi:RNA polymerase sigma-70 factor (ECF subfamily)
MLAADVVFTADGGGKRPAGPAPIVGIEAVLGLLGGLGRMFSRTPSKLVRYASINGLPGFVTIEPDGLPQTTAFDIRDGRIAAVYVMRNPDKLQRLDATRH